MYIKGSCNNYGKNVFVKFKGTDILQISKIIF